MVSRRSSRGRPGEVTREAVLAECRQRFEQRWGSPFDREMDKYLNGHRIAEEQNDAVEDEARKHFRDLRDVVSAAQKFVSGYVHGTGGMHAAMMNAAGQTWLPAARKMLDHAAQRRAQLGGERVGGWPQWLEHVRVVYSEEAANPPVPVSNEDLAVLRLLSGYWGFEKTQLDGFENPADAIKHVAKQVANAIRYANKGTN